MRLHYQDRTPADVATPLQHVREARALKTNNSAGLKEKRAREELTNKEHSILPSYFCEYLTKNRVPELVLAMSV